jgi:hypothetical protein
MLQAVTLWVSTAMSQARLAGAPVTEPRPAGSSRGSLNAPGLAEPDMDGRLGVAWRFRVMSCFPRSWRVDLGGCCSAIWFHLTCLWCRIAWCNCGVGTGLREVMRAPRTTSSRTRQAVARSGRRSGTRSSSRAWPTTSSWTPPTRSRTGLGGRVFKLGIFVGGVKEVRSTRAFGPIEPHPCAFVPGLRCTALPGEES